MIEGNSFLREYGIVMEGEKKSEGNQWAGNPVPHFPDVTTFVVTEDNLACSRWGSCEVISCQSLIEN